MERHSVEEDQVFAMLRDPSRGTSTTLVETAQASPKADGRPRVYQARQVCRDRKNPWPFGLEQLTPLMRDEQLNIFCRHVSPYGKVT